MGMNVGRLSCYVSCDDPCKRGCKQKTEKILGGVMRAEMHAKNNGWHKDEETGKWCCLACLDFEYQEHQRKAKEREKKDDGGGNLLTTLVVASLLTSGESPKSPGEEAENFKPGGGKFGGAGASGSFDEPEQPAEKEETAPEHEESVESESAPEQETSSSEESSSGESGGGGSSD